MDSQRTILSDLLSSTSGFINCTAPLNEQQYRATIKDATDRVRDVDRVWTSVLSDSARLQSLGSLVGTLVHKMIADILELADEPAGISEEQSKILKGYCDDIAGLADLFTDLHAKATASPDTGETTSLVHVYTPDWLRFIYLGEILEASLADIRYLWTKSELALEFEAAEVVDLVEALFADSSHRRDAIREIKSTGGT
jgi:centromere/kinetochore protein ZW10